jgi:hypothetical protein
MLVQQLGYCARHAADLGEFPQVRMHQEIDILYQFRRRWPKTDEGRIGVAEEARQQRGAQPLPDGSEPQWQLGQAQAGRRAGGPLLLPPSWS